MNKATGIFVVILLAAGGWFFFQNFDVGTEGDGVVIRPRAGGGAQTVSDPRDPIAGGRRETVRLASFNIQVFGASKASKPHVMEKLAEIVRRFDVVAIQEIRAVEQSIIPNFIDTINAGGRRYDYVIGPRLGRTSSKEQYAYIFDTATIEVDRHQVYTIDDPDDLLHRPPLVAWFRVRGPPREEAFTFTLVNLHTDPDEVPQELAALAKVYYAVRDDGRGEDDIILLGDFNANERQFGPLAQIAGMTWAIPASVPTNTRGNKNYDNLLFHRQATAEFTGRSGTFDFMREFNLTLDEAIELSDHLPVWGEFSAYEGGEPARVATGDKETAR